MVISKLAAAEIQLDSAIRHFFEYDYISTVTLAGAAEDILGGLLKAAGRQNSFEFLHDWYQRTYNTTIGAGDFSRQIANPSRNWLKHADDDSDSEMEIGERDAVLMLMRALPMYHALTSRYTKKMDKFNRHIAENINNVNALFA